MNVTGSRLSHRKQQMWVYVIAGLFVCDFVLCGYLPSQQRLASLQRTRAQQKQTILMAAAQSAELPGLERRLRGMEKAVEGFDLPRAGRPGPGHVPATDRRHHDGLPVWPNRWSFPGKEVEDRRSELCPHSRGVQGDPDGSLRFLPEAAEPGPAGAHREGRDGERQRPDRADRLAGGGRHFRAVGEVPQNQWPGRGPIGRWCESWRITEKINVPSAGRILDHLRMGGKKTAVACALFSIMLFMWVRVFVGHRPAAATAAAPPSAQAESAPAQSGGEGKARRAAQVAGTARCHRRRFLHVQKIGAYFRRNSAGRNAGTDKEVPVVSSNDAARSDPTTRTDDEAGSGAVE